MSTTHLLLRPSLCSPSLKTSFSSLTKPSNLTFRSTKLPPLNSLSITSPQTLIPQFPSSYPNPIFNSTNNIPSFNKKLICQATSETVVPATDRLISIISYFIPFLGGLSYGYHIFSAFPIIERAFDPLVPLLSFYKSIPGANFLTFFGLYVGIVRDRKFSRYVRFNALQAVFLEFLLVVPSLLHIMFNYGQGLGFKFLQVIHSAVFVIIFASFLYSLFWCLFGRTPNFPYVSGAMDSRLTAEDRWG